MQRPGFVPNANPAGPFKATSNHSILRIMNTLDRTEVQSGASVASPCASPPLVVDVDGSLVRGDLLVEGVLRLLASAPHILFMLPFTLARGRAALKRHVAQAVAVPPDTLVLNPAVVGEIAAAKAAGRAVWLASASDELAVAPLAASIGATGCFASDGSTNLAGPAKAAVLVERFGEGGFDYVGDERRDLAVWKHARRVIGVNLSARLRRRVRALDRDARFLPGPGGSALDVLKTLRPHQWVKNLLVFAPVIAAHETRLESWLLLAWLFAALSACASGTYLLNDLLDLPHDRRHRSKRRRPLAAGTVGLLPAMGLSAALVSAGLAAAFWLSAVAGLFVLLYLGAALAYSLTLKRRTFVDVITLAVLYTLRVLAGAAAASVMLSHWFLTFSLFVFLALAIVKRQGDIVSLREAGGDAAASRAYVAGDPVVMTALGAASGLASTVVLALYLHSPEARDSYARPELLWGVCPLLVYWLGRMALLANRGVVDSDPVVFALGDGASRLTGLGILILLAAAL